MVIIPMVILVEQFVARKALFIALLLSLTLTDCNCQRRQIVVRSVLLEMPTSVSGFSQKLDREKFSDLVKLVLEKDANFHFDANRSDGEVLNLSLILPAELNSNSSILLAAALSKDNENLGSSTKAFADIKIEDGRISGSEVSSSVIKVLQNLYQLRTGAREDSNEYLKKLEQSTSGENLGPGELINAVTVLSEMHEKRAEPLLIKLLEQTDSLSIGNSCIVALGDLQSVPGMTAIINFVERKPPILRRQAIIAARKIASKEAAEWLLVMAYGHDDPVVRDEAKAALQEVETKLGITGG